MNVRKIISGGQTGVDRAALDAALAKGIEIGGYVPKGRKAEDGKIPDRYYGLTETASAEPTVRTELNVINSDATLIISRGTLAGGSKLTAEFAQRHRKPFYHIDLNSVPAQAAIEAVNGWIKSNSYSTLNVAGPRGSEDPDIYDLASKVLDGVLS